MRISTTVSLLAVAAGLAVAPIVSAYTLTIGSPSAQASWCAGGGQMACTGQMTWVITPPTPQMRPTTGIVYLHAGGNADPVTDSAFMTITNIGSDTQDWTAMLDQIALSPPVYGGGGQAGPYTVEAAGFVAGAKVIGNYVQVNMSNG